MAYKFMNVAFELKMCTPFFKHYLIFYEKEEVVHCMYIYCITLLPYYFRADAVESLNI